MSDGCTRGTHLAGETPTQLCKNQVKLCQRRTCDIHTN
jgi:hypothetical protein